jgi:hypothetical protein
MMTQHCNESRVKQKSFFFHATTTDENLLCHLKYQHNFMSSYTIDKLFSVDFSHFFWSFSFLRSEEKNLIKIISPFVFKKSDDVERFRFPWSIYSIKDFDFDGVGWQGFEVKQLWSFGGYFFEEKSREHSRSFSLIKNIQKQPQNYFDFVKLLSFVVGDLLTYAMSLNKNILFLMHSNFPKFSTHVRMKRPKLEVFA